MNKSDIKTTLRAIANKCDGSHSCWYSGQLRNAADYIQEMETKLTKAERNNANLITQTDRLIIERQRLETGLAAEKRRADAAVEDLKEALYNPLSIDCEYCKYYGAETEEHIAEAGGCHACEDHGGFLVCFEWRGPQAAGKGEAE